MSERGEFLDAVGQCDLCHVEEVRTLLPLPTWSLAVCRGCGLVRLVPTPTPEELSVVYDGGSYYTHAAPRLNHSAAERLRRQVLAVFWGYPCPIGRLRRWMLRFVLWPLKARVMPVSYPADAPVLDVGCGNGQRLLELEDLGCSALLGIEPSAGAAEQARRHTRADIRTGLLEEAGLPDGHFQLVIMNQVLEHVPSPTATLSEAYRLLRHGGTLYLTVPNFGSFEARMFGPYWSGLQVPAHLHHFTAEPLKRLLTQAGFRISMLRTDTTLAVTEASVEDWSRARPSRWRVAVSRLPRVLYLPITLGVDLLGRGQMLRIVAQKD